MDKAENLRMARKFKDVLLKNFSLKKLILFGSRAREDFREDSDFDFIVVSDSFDKSRRLGRLGMVYDYWEKDYPADMICLTSEEFEKWKDNMQTVIGLAVSEGVEI